MKIDVYKRQKYVTYVIDTLRAGSTQTLSFAVTVDEKATSEDVILNTAEIKETTEKDLNEDGNIPDDLWNEDFKETNTTKHPLSNWATDIKTVKVGTPDSYIEKRADSAVDDVGETIHYTIVAEQTTKDGKLTNAVVEDKDLPDGVDIDYDSIKVDGNTVPEQDTMTSDTNSIYLIRTKKGFKVEMCIRDRDLFMNFSVKNPNKRKNTYYSQILIYRQHFTQNFTADNACFFFIIFIS